MKFDERGHLKHTDYDGDRLTADVDVRAVSDGFLLLAIKGHVVSMTREEARKFAKAIRKEVRRQVWEIT